MQLFARINKCVDFRSLYLKHNALLNLLYYKLFICNIYYIFSVLCAFVSKFHLRYNTHRGSVLGAFRIVPVYILRIQSPERRILAIAYYSRQGASYTSTRNSHGRRGCSNGRRRCSRARSFVANSHAVIYILS